MRGLMVEAAWHAARTTGPLRAFHRRIAARRGVNIATVAVARKLVVIAWHRVARTWKARVAVDVEMQQIARARPF